MNRVLIPNVTASPVAPPHDARPVEFGGETMGTTWRLRGFAPPSLDQARLEAEISALFDEIIDQMSPWRAGSTINQFNAAPAGAQIALPVRFRAVLACALSIAAETDGAFDPTLGALVDLWGFGAAPPQHATPQQHELDAARGASGWRKLQCEGESLRQPGGVRLDLNGVAKGYAVDEAARLARGAGLHACLIEIGGELHGAGVKPNGEPWWVELEQPPGSATAPILAALYNTAIATSGDYRRSDVVDGARISHTIAPDTGAPITNGVASVSVLHASCMRGDAYATALQVLGPQAGMAFAARAELTAIMRVRTEAGFAEHISPEAARLLSD